MLKSDKYILSFIIVLLMTGINLSYAQVKVQVVTLEINKTIRWEPGMSLWVQAERAEIFCTTHPSNTIELEVAIIAKNESRKSAETDLKKMKWLNETRGKKIFLRNYIELKRNESKPGSDIKVVYHIKIPERCAVNINNYFGKIDVENFNYKLTVNSQFSKIDLGNIGGKTTIKTYFGDVTARGIAGEIFIESVRSDIDLSDVAGVIDLQSKLAEIILVGIDEITKINLDAEKSKIHLITGDYDRFSFRLDLYKAELSKPGNMKFEYAKNEKETIKATFNNTEGYPRINIKLNTGNLTIER